MLDVATAIAAAEGRRPCVVGVPVGIPHNVGHLALEFQLVDALLQVIVSGFAGMLTMLLCWYITAPLPLCGFMAGMAGLMGSKALDIYERRASGIMRGGKGNGTLD